MKKNYIFKFLLLLIPVSAFLMMSSSGGRTDGRSGSPGDGGITCTACHSEGANFNTTAEITTNIPITGYLLNTDYTINVNSTSSSTKLGFQLTAENNSNTKIGTFTAGSGSRVGSQRVTQSTPSTSGDWSFTWRSPSTDLGRVTFYSAVNATNNNGNTSGDQVITVTSSAPSLSISDAQRLDFDMFPNPATDRLTIQLPSNTEKAEVQIYNYIGKLSLSKIISSDNNKIDVNDLSAGVYVLKVVTEDKIGTQKFVKE